MPIIQDIDIYGGETSKGIPIEIFDEDALKNALILWLTSNRGEFLKKPEMGGILKILQFKKLSHSILQRVRFTIKNAITNYFQPSIKLIAINIYPINERRYLEIEIIYQGLFTGREEKIAFYTDGERKVEDFKYQEIFHTGETLRNFIFVLKPTYPNTKLLYNYTEDCWMWGKFKFINFNNGEKVLWTDLDGDNIIDPGELNPEPTDPYFNEIFSLANLT